MHIVIQVIREYYTGRHLQNLLPKRLSLTDFLERVRYGLAISGLSIFPKSLINLHYATFCSLRYNSVVIRREVIDPLAQAFCLS